MPKNDEVPGDARASSMAFQRSMNRISTPLLRAEDTFDSLFDDEIEIRSFSVRLPQSVGGDYLITVRAYVEGVPHVGFHAADCLAEVVRGMLTRMLNRSMKWKADEYDTGRNGSDGEGGGH